MGTDNLSNLMQPFASSHFMYCQLTWMFYDRALKRYINHIHEKELRLEYNDNETEFESSM